MENSDSPMFIVNTSEAIVGIRMDRVLSFTFDPAKGCLSVRYIGEGTEEKFEGPIAEGVLRELRYLGRK
jgi:hypothetical protein